MKIGLEVQFCKNELVQMGRMMTYMGKSYVRDFVWNVAVGKRLGFLIGYGNA